MTKYPRLLSLAVLLGTSLSACSDDPMANNSISTTLRMDSTSLSVSWETTCGIATDGAMYCFGSNWRGMLGDGTIIDRWTPVPVSGGHRFVSVSASSWTTCGLKADSTAWCWGDNQYGELGVAVVDTTMSRHLAPERVVTSEKFVTISAGGLQTCALTSTGKAFCWGSNYYGGLGNPSAAREQPTPVAVSTNKNFRSIVSGDARVCAVTFDNEGYCWGQRFGAKGEDTMSARTPMLVDATISWQSFTPPGGSSMCGLALDNKLYCWGILKYGDRAGAPPLKESATPLLIAIFPRSSDLNGWCLTDIKRCITYDVSYGILDVDVPAPAFVNLTGTVDYAVKRACGVTAANQLYCWGDYYPGNGTAGAASTPQLVSGNISWRP